MQEQRKKNNKNVTKITGILIYVNCWPHSARAKDVVSMYRIKDFYVHSYTHTYTHNYIACNYTHIPTHTLK